MGAEMLGSLFLLTLRSPARAVRALRAQNLPMAERWMAAIVAVSVSALLNWVLSTMVNAPEATGAATPMMSLSRQPLLFAALQFGAVLITATLMARVGQLFGGTGGFADALLLVTWVEVMLLSVQLAQILLLVIFPPLAALLGLAALVLFIGLTVLFTKELHEFDNVAKVALGVVLTAMAAVFVMSFLAAAFGILPEVPA